MKTENIDLDSGYLRVGARKPTPIYLSEETTEVACHDCDLPYDEFGMDTTVPNLQWEMIMGHEGGILCASCMVKRASKIRGVLAARMVFEIIPSDPVGDQFKGLEYILRNRTDYNETP